MAMKVREKTPPRSFTVGVNKDITIKDCAEIALAPDEQVTFVTESGGEYDVARKDWGFYATPSLNGRLPQFGLRAALVKSAQDKIYIVLVERGKEALFDTYLNDEKLSLVRYFDSAD